MDDLPPPIKITPDSPNIPKPIEVTVLKQSNFKRIFVWASKIKWTKVTLYFAGFGAFLALILSHPVFKNAVNHYFPNSSPVFGRDVSFQGVLKSSSTGLYTLVLPDSSSYILHFKPSVSLTNLKKLREVIIKGNFTWEPFVIENVEVYPLNFIIPDDPDSSASQGVALEPVIPPNTPELPSLYSNLQWEATQKRVLIFTSGKRKIEQEGIYLESAQVSTFPQEFINYYIEELKAESFKETLNSINPEGITITYAKDDLFLTFGIKNIYKGSGSAKQLSGYRAFMEHN